MRRGLIALWLVILATGSAPAQPAAATVSANPPRVCADNRANKYLNFDLVIRNGTDKSLSVNQIEARSFDSTGALIERRILWQDAISTLGPNRTIEAGGQGLIYNPFAFETAPVATRIDYDLSFDGGRSARLEIRPQSCITRARLILPLTGRVLISDGYDFFAHHRRMNWHFRDDLRTFGIVDNVYRFGLDMLPIDERGSFFRGDGSKMEDWYGWNMPVRSPADGVVSASRDDMPDNALGSEDYPKKRLNEDEMNPDGNYVLIDHGNGEFSTATHLKAGSATVKVGEHVKAGQVIARIGNSGATPVPHLHYELRTGFGVRGVRSLPAYFNDVEIIGQPSLPAPIAINTGDVVIAR
jgi:hypothetical protein